MSYTRGIEDIIQFQFKNEIRKGVIESILLRSVPLSYLLFSENYYYVVTENDIIKEETTKID